MSYRASVHKDNRNIVQYLRDSVKDENGNFPFGPSTWDIILAIGRFSQDIGCFMTPQTLAKEIGPKINHRTVSRIQKYLKDQDIISICLWAKDGKTRSTKRLKKPKNTTIESMVKYRKRTKQYTYKTKKDSLDINTKSEYTPDNLDMFFDYLTSDKLSIDPCQNVPLTPDKLCTQIVSMNNKENIKKTPYIPPLEKEVNETKSIRRPEDALRVGIRRPCKSRLRAHDLGGRESTSNKNQEINMSELFEDSIGEPLAPKKKKKQQTKKERKQEAIKKHNQGHIVNPLGSPDNTPRRLSWKRARDIGPEGSVTVAQLYRHLIKTYQDSIGISVEDQLPQDRYAVQSWFDGLRQRFIQISGYTPSYRDISEYFTWILNPKRFRNPKELAKFNVFQIEGKIYIKQFYDRILKVKDSNQVETINPSILKHRKALESIEKAFDTIEQTIKSNTATVFSMGRFGLVVMVQYLHERKSLSENNCRKRIIETMTSFVSNSTSKTGAIEYLNEIVKTTDKMKYVYNKNFLWYNWKEECKSVIESVLEITDGKKEVQKD